MMCPSINATRSSQIDYPGEKEEKKNNGVPAIGES